jgi:hypothetical protein
MLIDAACGFTPGEPKRRDVPPKRRELTLEQKKLCDELGRQVLWDLRNAYPEVVKVRPTTWPLHLRNTISIKAETMLRDLLEELCATEGADGFEEGEEVPGGSAE